MKESPNTTVKNNSVTGNNNTVVDGKHIISGNNNNVGINGDVNVTSEIRLKQIDLDAVLLELSQLSAKFKTRCLSFYFSIGSNGQNVLTQVRNAAETEGYQITKGQSSFIPIDPISRFQVNFNERTGCLNIIVGNF